MCIRDRNKYLTPKEREAAPVLYRALTMAKTAVETGGMMESEDVFTMMRREIKATGLFQIDYIAVVNADSFEPVEKFERDAIILLAAKIGTTRLIDNILISPAN